jgi:adenylate kinase
MSIARLIADEMARKTPSGVVCKKVIHAGDPIPDEVVLGLARRQFWSRRASRGFVAEGFPFTVAQAMVFDEWLDGRDEALTACVLLEQGESELLDEAARTWRCPTDGSLYVESWDAQVVPGHCNACRTALEPAGDAMADGIRWWFQCCESSVRAVAAHYETRGLLVRVGGTVSRQQAIEDVLNRIAELVVDR